LSSYKGYVPVEILSHNRFPSIREDTPYFVTLGPYGSQSFVLERAHAEMEREDRLPTLVLERWRDLLNREVLDEHGNEVLPSYLMRLRWFGGKGRGLESVRIVDHANVPLEENSTYILLAEVSYRDGLPDLYQLPVAFAKGQPAYKLH